MKLPILEKLKNGEKFDFEILADNTDQTDEFWDWWWAERADVSKISRPEIINEDDPILRETIDKSIAHLCSYSDLFENPLFNLVRKNSFPSADSISRETLQHAILNQVFRGSVKLPDKAQLVFTGGGYGSGKTVIVNRLCDRGVLPMPLKCLVGPDVIKQLIPEYHLVKAVADGRASAVVQKECVALAQTLYRRLVQNGLSFAWDSSMSDYETTLERIMLAKENGFGLTMVAVFTPLETAVRQAMHRARKSRRFPNADALPKSNQGFRTNFAKYLEHFDVIKVFANMGDGKDSYVIAEKNGLGNALEVFDSNLFQSVVAC